MEEKMDIVTETNPKKDEVQQNVIINCKFEGVFEADKNESLLKYYKELVHLCNLKMSLCVQIAYKKQLLSLRPKNKSSMRICKKHTHNSKNTRDNYREYLCRFPRKCFLSYKNYSRYIHH